MHDWYDRHTQRPSAPPPLTLFLSSGVDYKTKVVSVAGKRVQLSIWDTAGQEKFRSLTSAYYRGTQGIVLAYDVSNRGSFESVAAWQKEADMYCTYENVVKLLVANKIDRDDAQVTRADGERFAREHGMVFVECSAKTRKNIEQVFEELVLKFLERSDLWGESRNATASATAKMQIKPLQEAPVDSMGCAC